jgi:hypothetical protein
MDSITTDFGDVVLWSVWFFIWTAALVVWARCLFDVFTDSTVSGLGKAGWVALMIFAPLIGALIYLVVRGARTPEREPAAGEHRQAAGGSTDPAAQIASAKSLLDFGAIDQAEYDALKAKALAEAT